MPASSTLKSALLAAAAALAAGVTAHAQEAPADRPNILLIITDDIGFDVTTGMFPGLVEDVAAHYGPEGLNHPEAARISGHPASTPVLDAFARESMVFSNAWAEPFCSPTRASLLTGLFSAKTHILTYADALSHYHASFVRQLKDEGGYATAVFGKWHMAGLPGQPVDYPGMKPLEAGFDLFQGNLHAAINTYWDYDYQIQDGDTAPDEWRTEPAPRRSLPGIAPTTYAPVVKAADTIDWIAAREAADPDTPWFAWLAFNLSHATAAREPSQMVVPNADTLTPAAHDEMAACHGEFGSANVGDCSGEALMRAMTNSVDTVIGKVLDAVEALDSDTYVILIGDNGTPMYGRPNLDFIDNLYITRAGRGKGTAYESGARVALAIRGPGISGGARSDEYVHAADLFSTALDLAGLRAPVDVPNSAGDGAVSLDSISLKPILTGRTASIRDPDHGYLLTESRNLMTAGTEQVGARNASYKLMCEGSAATDACEFYHLAEDPLEEYPLAKPDNCAAYAADAWTPADPEWHFCRLQQVVATESFFRDAE